MKVPVKNKAGEVIGHIEFIDGSATDEEKEKLRALFLMMIDFQGIKEET